MYYWNGRDNAPTQGTVAKDMHAKCKDIRQPRMRRDAGMGQRKQLLGAALAKPVKKLHDGKTVFPLPYK